MVVALLIEAEELALAPHHSASLREVSHLVAGTRLILHLTQHAGLHHLLVEVTAVEMHPKDALIEALQVADAELLLQQTETDRLEVDVLADAAHRLTEDKVVVECQLRNVVDTHHLALAASSPPFTSDWRASA